MATEIYCLACGKLADSHARYTAEDVAASKGATFKEPKNGYYCPISPSVIGMYKGHDPVIPICGTGKRTGPGTGC